MAVAAYTTDLTDIADLDTTGGTAVEPAALYNAGRSPAEDDTDFPVQGTVHASLTMNTTGKAGILVPGTSWTHTSGDYIFGWVIWLAPGAIATYAAGGLSILLGSDATNFDVHWVGGKDFGKYPKGGWQNFAVDPERTPDESNGTSPTAYHYVGAGANVLSAVAKGNPLGFDVFRYGRGETRIVGGTSTDADANFAGLAAANDANTAQWGLFEALEDGKAGYRFKGKMVIGYGGACDFTDSDVNIFIENTELVSADFNRIELTTATSNVDWTNISITALGTVSRGQFEMMDNCSHPDTGGVYTDMDTFIYQSNADITGRTWRRCNKVTQGGATIANSLFDKCTDTIALLANDLSLVSGCDFVSDGTGYGIEGFSVAGSYTLTDITFSGYASSDGSTGNEALHVTATTGTVTIYHSGAAPSVDSDGATIVKVGTSVDITVTVLSAATGLPIELAHVRLLKDSDKSVLISGATNSSGVITTSYSGTTPIDVVGWARQMDLSGTDYEQQDIGGEVTSSGFAVTVRLQPISVS